MGYTIFSVSHNVFFGFMVAKTKRFLELALAGGYEFFL